MPLPESQLRAAIKEIVQCGRTTLSIADIQSDQRIRIREAHQIFARRNRKSLADRRVKGGGATIRRRSNGSRLSRRKGFHVRGKLSRCPKCGKRVRKIKTLGEWTYFRAKSSKLHQCRFKMPPPHFVQGGAPGMGKRA